MQCKQCNVQLAADEIAIYAKLVTRNAAEFLCIGCLAAELNCTRAAIEERIKYYKESGNCVLFVK